MEDCKRTDDSRRGVDRRVQALTVSVDRRNDQRRSGFDRRELLSDPVS
tara:strand:- start:641 stop:784 length:144 start_codon:yes stop_codon:yes gene_type:complete